MENKHININIIGSSLYLPKNKVNNEFFNDHFKKQGIKSENLYTSLGRNTRYLKDKEENTQTMGYQVATKVLEENNINPKDIDMVVFATDSPEYTVPTTAMTIHKSLGTSNAHMVLDLNQNCASMLAAIDITSRYMKSSDDIKKALLVSVFNASLLANKQDPVTYGALTDGATAVVLEKEVSKDKRGFIDSCYKADSNDWEGMVFPAKGLTNAIDNFDCDINDKKMHWTAEDPGLDVQTEKTIRKILHKNNLSIEDIDYFIVSQFSTDISKSIADMLNVDESKFIITSDKFGYMGNASPISCFKELVEKYPIKKGDKIILSTVGSGYVVNTLLYQF